MKKISLRAIQMEGYSVFRKVSYVLAGLFLLVSGVLQAQFQKPDVSMPSPNAASLGLYGEVPVSLYTGTPNIDIPLYTIEEGSIKVPISLSYHASGVRVNQHPGWVGLNWNLNAGGAITRTVKGNAFDEHLGISTSLELVGYYFQDAMKSSNWETKEFARDAAVSNVDTEPDDFDFNFLGLSGTFYLTQNHTWSIRSNQNLKVVVDNDLLPIPNELIQSCEGPPDITYARSPKSFKGFTIIDDNGFQYYFGGSSESIEYSIPFFGQVRNDGNVPGKWVANSWYLSKITTPEGQEVKFNYSILDCNQGRFVASFTPSWTSSPYRSTSSYGNIFNGSVCSTNSTSLSIPLEGFYNGSLTRPVYLSSIITNTRKIDFTSSVSNEKNYSTRILKTFFDRDEFNDVPDGVFPFLLLNENPGRSRNDRIQVLLNALVWRKLENIKIFDKSNRLMHSVECKYNTEVEPTQRLMLKKVSLVSKDDVNCKNNYDFEYYNDLVLPEYLDEQSKTDHWGFFNNRDYDLNYLVDDIVSGRGFQFFKSSKESSTDITVLRSGSLKQITYPTGGTTTLNYERHSISKIKETNSDGSFYIRSTTDESMGGLRIQSIVTHDGTSTKVKTFTYELPTGEGSGISSGKHIYETQSYKLGSCAPSGATTSYETKIYSIQNTLPGSINSLGSPIGYSRVVERNSDNSYRVLNFTNFESIDGNHYDEAVAANLRIPGSDGNKYEPFIDKSFERGLPLSEEKYNASNILLYKKTTQYKKISDDYVRAVFVRSLTACESGLQACSGFPYRISTYKYLPEKEETYQYEDQNKYTYDLVEYQYNGIGLPSEIKTTRNGKTTITKNTYVEDFVNVPTNEPHRFDSWAITKMKAKYMVGMPVEQQIWNNDNAEGDFRMVDGYLNMYDEFNFFSSNPIYKVRYIRQFTTVPPPTNVALASNIFRNGQFEVDFNEGYTKNLVSFTTGNDGYTLRGEPKRFLDANGLVHAYNWYDGDKAGLLQSKKVGDMETTFEYSNPLVGVSRISDKNTNTWVDYTYDGFNRLSTIKDYKGNLVQSFAYNLKSSTGCDSKPTLVEATGTGNPEDPVGSCVVNKIKLQFRMPGDCCMERLVGAKIQGSNNGTTWTDIYTFGASGTGSMVEYTFSNSTAYSSLRFVASSTGWGEVAELEFYNGNTKLSGTPFGAANYSLAFDGLNTTKWEGPSMGSGNIIGLNLTGCGTVCTPPAAPQVTISLGSTVCASNSQTVELTATGSGGNVTWYKDGVQVGSGTSNTYTASAAGTYTAKRTIDDCTSGALSGQAVQQTQGCGDPVGSCVVNKVKLQFRTPGDCCMERLVGAKIQGSNNGTTWTDIYTFGASGTGSMVEYTFSNSTAYSSLRFVASSTGWGEVAELEFYSGNTKLSGTPFGTANYSLAFDGLNTTKWEGPSMGSGNIIGLNLSSCVDPVGSCVVNKIKLQFRTPGDCCMERLVGAKIQGSSNGTTWTDIYTFGASGTGSMVEYTFSNSTAYSSLRFVASSTGWGEVAELEFYNGNTKLSGTPFGAANYSLAFDGLNTTKWEGPSMGSGNIIGLNLTGCGTP